MSPLKLLQFTCQAGVLLSRLLLRKEGRKVLLAKSVRVIPFSFEPPLNDLGAFILKNTQRDSKDITQPISDRW